MRNAGALLLAALLALAPGLAHADGFGGVGSGAGEPGPTGPEGPQGEQGPAGSDGSDGAPGAPGANANSLTSGGSVIWTGTGYVFRASATEGVIGGEAFAAPETEVTLSEADETLDRFDVIVATVTGTIEVVEGDAAASPVKPTLDPTTQLELTFVRVDAASTEPADVSVETIFTEGGVESWTESEVGTTINVAGSANCRTGSVCVVGTSVTSGDSFTFVDSGTFVLSSFNVLNFYVRPPSGWAGSRGWAIQWLNGTTPVGSQVLLRNGTFGLDTASVAYQQIAIPVSLFAAEGLLVDRVTFSRAGSSTISATFDDFSLQGGVQQTNVGTASLQYKRTWAGTTNYLTNQAVLHESNLYVALQNNTNVEPGTAATVWEAVTSPNALKRTLGGYIGAVNGSALVDGDDMPSCFVNNLGYSITLTECCTTVDSTTGSPSFMFQRDDGSPANILAGNLAGSTSAGGGCTTSFSGSENVIADGQEVDCNVVTAGGTAKYASMVCSYTVP